VLRGPRSRSTTMGAICTPAESSTLTPTQLNCPVWLCRELAPKFEPWIRRAIAALAQHRLPPGRILVPACGSGACMHWRQVTNDASILDATADASGKITELFRLHLHESGGLQMLVWQRKTPAVWA